MIHTDGTPTYANRRDWPMEREPDVCVQCGFIDPTHDERIETVVLGPGDTIPAGIFLRIVGPVNG